MNNQRPNQHERGEQRQRGGGADDRERHQMGDPTHFRSQFGSRDDWRGGNWDQESREGRQMGAGDDRFGGYTGNYDDAGRFDARAENGSPSPWDEERFAYPEPERFRREPRHAGPGPQSSHGADWSRGPERYYWQNRYGGSSQFGPNGPSNFAPRGQSYRQNVDTDRSHNDRYGRFGQPDWGGESFAGGRDVWSGSNRSYGIPSGSEPGGYSFNSTWNDGSAHNWSGSNWASDQDWNQGRRQAGAGIRPGGSTPKGYTRSDDRIRDDVCEMLYRAHDIDVSNVSVESKSGTITLEGTVSDRRMKHRIEDLCEHCIGVNDVDNRIRVVREASSGFLTDRGRNESGADDRSTAGVSTSSSKKSTAGNTPH